MCGCNGVNKGNRVMVFNPSSSPNERTLKSKAVNFVAFLAPSPFERVGVRRLRRLHRTHVNLMTLTRVVPSKTTGIFY